jgi:hypothetical protein
VILLDRLRPPSPFDLEPAAYKDWLHLNVFEHATGVVGLVNLSLHGSPDDPRARAVGTALFHVPGVGWLGNAEVSGLREAKVGEAGIAMQRVALAIHYGSGTVLASADFPDDDLSLQLTASAETPAIDFEQRFPLRSGWVSWYLVPSLSVAGRLEVAGRVIDLESARAYHDHNWGRWYWGDDLGWEWSSLVGPGPERFTCVLVRTTDSAHQHIEAATLMVYAGGLRRTFRGAAVQVELVQRVERAGRRIPGPMAALHQDRIAVRLPYRMRMHAYDGIDRVELEFESSASAQVVAADPMVRGYGFINEIVGSFTGRARLGAIDRTVTGLGVLEYVI